MNLGDKIRRYKFSTDRVIKKRTFVKQEYAYSDEEEADWVVLDVEQSKSGVINWNWNSFLQSSIAKKTVVSTNVFENGNVIVIGIPKNPYTYLSDYIRSLVAKEIDEKGNFTYGGSYAVETHMVDNMQPFFKIENTEFSKIETIYSQVLGTTDQQVILKCLIDKELKFFQTRKFDILPFENAVDLTTNGFVKITIYTKPGERKFTYENIERSTELAEIFEPKNYFEGLENSPFFKSSKK